jgi:1-acyl-sn-glycerol-3-phosphate acyltransferase
MKKELIDRKNWLTYLFWSTVNKLVLRRRFKSLRIEGLEHLPPAGQPFVLVSNHISRWDGLLIYFMLGRPANFLVSPNELAGFQGSVLKSMGSFPASTQFDLKAHVQRQLAKGEPVVIFPEGDVYRDGSTHPFKSGAARFAVAAARQGLDVPVVPIAIQFEQNQKSVRLLIAPPIAVDSYADTVGDAEKGGVRSLTERLQREVCHLKYEMGCSADHAAHFAPHVMHFGKPA